MSRDFEKNIKSEEVLSFNAQFEKYADRTSETGYLSEKNAISLQEFVTICNTIRDLKERVPADAVEINVNERSSANIKNYLKDSSKPLEQLLSNLKDAELYYFTFTSKDIEYNEERTSF